MSELRYPKFSKVANHDDPERSYRLDEYFQFDTPIKGEVVQIPHAKLIASGKLTCYKGFRWDLASGPAIDTPDMVVASLAHDALCRMTVEGVLDWKHRRAADKFFRKTLKKYGTFFIRRWYAYLAVRWFSIVRKRKRE